MVKILRSQDRPNKNVPVIFLFAYLTDAIQASRIYTDVYLITKTVIFSKRYKTIGLAVKAS